MNHLIKKLISFMTVILFTTSSVYATNPYTENPRVLTPPIWKPDNSAFEDSLRETDRMLEESAMGITEYYDESNKKVINYVDGYSFVFPSNMIVDFSKSDVCTTVSDNNLVIRVFKENFSSTYDLHSYLNYSNKFIQNTADHTVELSTSYESGNFSYKVLQWYRSTASRIQNDKNYYACVDVTSGLNVYTFFFSSSIPFSQQGGYMRFVDSLVTFNPTVDHTRAFNKGYRQTDISRLNESAKETYNSLFSSDASFKMGMFAPDRFGGTNRMEQIEKQIGYKFCAFLVYTEITDKAGMDYVEYHKKVQDYVSAVEGNMRYAQQTERAIELTLQTPLARTNSTANMIYEILNGEYDLFIETYANMISRYQDVTVLFRPFNEMNGDWCNYSAFHTSRDPQIYVELYRYLYKKFNEAGCTNTIWVWNPNEKSFPNYKWNNESLYYPGDEYVDVYGITGYNTGTYYSGEKWRSFNEIYTPIYERAIKLNDKPVMITEFSCSGIGGNKTKWIEDMFKVLPKFNKIKVGIWWHATDWDGDEQSRPYFIDSPAGALNIFDKYLN